MSALAFWNFRPSRPMDDRAAYFQGYVIELQDVKPYPETIDQKIPATDYSATIVVRQAEPPKSVKKNEPFVLKPGQTATIVDENLTVTFVRVPSDSRCPVNVQCFIRGNAAC